MINLTRPHVLVNHIFCQSFGIGETEDPMIKITRLHTPVNYIFCQIFQPLKIEEPMINITHVRMPVKSFSVNLSREGEGEIR